MSGTGRSAPNSLRSFYLMFHGVFYGPFLFIYECYGYSSEDNHECNRIPTKHLTSFVTMVHIPHR